MTVKERKKKRYAELLRDPRWQKMRLKIMERDGWKCALCGDKDTTLNVHHHSYCGMPWDAKEEDLVTLCEPCHKHIPQIVELAKKETSGSKPTLFEIIGVFQHSLRVVPLSKIHFLLMGVHFSCHHIYKSHVR